MGVLNTFQKISRVLPNLPFGSGRGGNTTISTDDNTRATVTGTATTPNISLGSAILSNGDLFLIHQTRGTNAGQWEINRVLSGGGTTSIVCQEDLEYTYTAGAQVIKFVDYLNVTVTAHSVTDWDGEKGAVRVICGRNSITVDGAITGTGKGFRGSPRGTTDGNGSNAEGKVAFPDTRENGAGWDGNAVAGGGGGGSVRGYGGGNGGVPDSRTNWGYAIQNTTDLTSLLLPGGGGAGGTSNSNSSSDGGDGGAIVILISDTIITTTAGVVNNGAGTTGGVERSGGGGGGGCNLFICRIATIGTNKNTATGGVAGTATADTGGNGGVGRNTIHHSGEVVGTTNPTFTDVSDNTLVSLSPSAIFAALV